MEEVEIPQETEVEEYFIDLPYSTEDRLHRYPKIDQPDYDELTGRYTQAKDKDTRKGKIINNRLYINLGQGCWSLVAIKLPDGGIIGVDRVKLPQLLKPQNYFCFMTDDEWEDEKELMRIEKLAKEGGVKCIDDYRLLREL